MKPPFLIDDIDALRHRLLSLKKRDGKPGELWDLLKTSARSAPADFSWFTFFVALITQEEKDIENAKNAIWIYIRKLEPMSFCTGLQFHFWCFAFPHAKICLYFQWLCSMDAFTPAEVKDISEKLIMYQFVNFYYGMRSKPDPECVDNQTLSLTLSCTLVGYLFSQGDTSSKMADIMLREGSRRLPHVIGDMPVSGYSGEGSSYMDCVNGPAIPLSVELLERIRGESGLLYQTFTPDGGQPIQVLKMVAREFMPGGLLLPWDNYGYQYGVRGAIAYGAKKTGLPLFYDVLATKTTWTYDIGTGWAYDDLVWTLIWWPDEPVSASSKEQHWFEPMVGGALLSRDNNHYVMQMWDPSEPHIPTRSHVNPNALIFNGYGIPVSADGSPNRDLPHRFWFDDTWRTVSFMEMGSDSRYNFGDGCGGAHSVILIDGKESLRAHSEYEQITEASFTLNPPGLFSNCTPIYQENFPDVKKVSRKTSLLADRLFVIEDQILAEAEHDITSRFLFRPEVSLGAHSVWVQTPEGVSLSLFDVHKKAAITGEGVENFPLLPDNRSFLCDFTQRGQKVTGLYVALLSNGRRDSRELLELELIFDLQGEWNLMEASKALSESAFRGTLRLPAYMEQELPNHRRWWYRANITLLPGEDYIKLPAGILNPKLYLNGEDICLDSYAFSMALLAPRIKIPMDMQQEKRIEIVLRTDVPISHYDGGGDGTIGLSGGLWLGKSTEQEVIVDAAYQDQILTVTTNQRIFQEPYCPEFEEVSL